MLVFFVSPFYRIKNCLLVYISRLIFQRRFRILVVNIKSYYIAVKNKNAACEY